MKQYDSYKDSGTPWIGQIPSHWEEKRMRFVCDYQKGKNPSNLSFDFETGMLPYLSMDYLRESTDNTQYTFPENDFVLCEDGDFLLLWDGSNAGEFLHSKKGVLCSTCAKLFPKGHSEKYFEYVCKSVQHYLQDMTNGMGIPHVDANVFKNLRTLVPPISEQEAIASYLDKKCSSIDKIIATQEKRIALLGELKQSIITEAVTRGLNPDAPLKDSGIDWIGKIPEHWEATPLKFTGLFGNGLTYSPDDVVESDGVLVLRSSNIQDDMLDLNDTIYVKSSPDFLMVLPGDIIICSRNGSASLVGKCAFVNELINATFGAFMMRYRPYEDKKYGYYLLQAALKMYKGLYSTTTINQLTMGVIAQIHVAMPPITEQKLIADYLDAKCARIDKSITKAKREVELLREYKQTIITEAVTGKIKVC